MKASRQQLIREHYQLTKANIPLGYLHLNYRPTDLKLLEKKVIQL